VALAPLENETVEADASEPIMVCASRLGVQSGSPFLPGGRILLCFVVEAILINAGP